MEFLQINKDISKELSLKKKELEQSKLRMVMLTSEILERNDDVEKLLKRNKNIIMEE
jgi:hypothetical protein